MSHKKLILKRTKLLRRWTIVNLLFPFVPYQPMNKKQSNEKPRIAATVLTFFFPTRYIGTILGLIYVNSQIKLLNNKVDENN